MRGRDAAAVSALLEAAPWTPLNHAGRTAVEEALALNASEPVAALVRGRCQAALKAGAPLLTSAKYPPGTETILDHYWACRCEFNRR